MDNIYFEILHIQSGNVYSLNYELTDPDQIDIFQKKSVEEITYPFTFQRNINPKINWYTSILDWFENLIS